MVERQRAAYLRGPDFYVEVASFVRDLKDFRPREAVDSQLILVDHQAAGADAQHDVHTLKVLKREQSRALLTTEHSLPLAVTVQIKQEAQ